MKNEHIQDIHPLRPILFDLGNVYQLRNSGNCVWLDACWNYYCFCCQYDFVRLVMFDEISTADIKNEIQEIELDLMRIKTQLSANQAAIVSGDNHRDADWTHKAATAKRFKQFRLAALKEALAIRNKAAKVARAKGLNAAFVDVARANLVPNTFFCLLEEARRLNEQNQEDDVINE
jgi:hypothetical protein